MAGRGQKERRSGETGFGCKRQTGQSANESRRGMKVSKRTQKRTISEGILHLHTVHATGSYSCRRWRGRLFRRAELCLLLQLSSSAGSSSSTRVSARLNNPRVTIEQNRSSSIDLAKPVLSTLVLVVRYFRKLSVIFAEQGALSADPQCNGGLPKSASPRPGS